MMESLIQRTQPIRPKKYLYLIRTGFREAAVYRTDTLMAFGSAAVFIVLHYSLWSAIAASGQLSSPLPEIMTYIITGQIVATTIGIDPEAKFGAKIRKGTIVNELKRPITFTAQMYAHYLGRSLFNLLSRGIPVAAVGVVLFNVSIPNTMHLAAFAVSLFLGYNLVFALSFLFGMFVFWTKVEWSVRLTRNLLQSLFSGVLFPLYLLPGHLKPVFYALPFQAIVDGPIQVFTMQRHGTAVLTLFAEQLLWTGVFLVAGHLLWQKARTQMTVQGG